MLLVNNTALDTATPVQLTHAGWNLGLHLADMVLPWFVFCVGVSIPFSAGSFLDKGRSKVAYLGKVLTRSFALIGIGMLLDCAINRQLDVSLGVLQLIGMAYFVGAMIYAGPGWFRPVAAVILLGGYATAIMNVSFPGGRAGVFEENRNLIHHLNLAYLTPYKMDGALSAIPAGGLVLFGTIMGDVLRRKDWQPIVKVSVLALSGWVLLLVGDTLSVFVAFNKPVFTPSYLMVAGGTGAIVLAAFMLVADMMKMQKLAVPLIVLGSNAIAAYVLPILVKVMVLQTWVISTPKGNVPIQQAGLDWLKLNYGFIHGGWAYTAIYIGVWWVVLAILYRKRLFLRV
jgi:predicted acyltransferase